jgi:NAD-dependent deacetylase
VLYFSKYYWIPNFTSKYYCYTKEFVHMEKIVIFSGAGMSAESGIDTFRKSGGLWAQYKIEDVATPEAWKNNSHKVQEFYNLRRKQIRTVEPNYGHLIIAEMEQFGETIVVTQNIDDLHERAGSSHVLHLHGNIRYAKSSGPNQEKTYYPIEGDYLSPTDLCPDGYPLRPHVVWFGEEVPMYEEAKLVIESATIFIVVGTSLNVHPAAGLIHYANRARLKVVIDPDEQLGVPANFHHLKLSASEGLKTCLDWI